MGSVSVLLVRPLVAALGSGALAELWGSTDLTSQLLADDDARISAAQFCVAWSELIRLSGDPAIALRIAGSLPAGAFGIVEYVCRSAPTLGDALRRWVRYLNLLDDATVVGLASDDDRALLRVEVESEAPAPASHELCFALVAKYARELSAQPLRITGVEFAHRAPPELAPYRAWFAAPVRFGAEATQLILPAAALAAPLVSSDPTLLAILTRAADELERAVPQDATFTAQVARTLREVLRGDDANVDFVAKRLGMTARSLQRRLRDEGTSFHAVREQTRRALAARYLDDKLSIAEVSFLLGFSEPSAFFRAYKRWTGGTPRGQATAGGVA